MDYEYEDPAVEGGDEMDVEGQESDNMMEEEDIPVTQEDAWAAIRFVECRST